MGRKRQLRIVIGEQFGRWTVIGPEEDRKHLCRCECGQECLVVKYNLLKGYSKGCRSCQKRPPGHNLLGLRFGQWTVLAYTGRGRWKVRCDCGAEHTRDTGSLRTGRSTMCRKCMRALKADHDQRAIIQASFRAGVKAAAIARVLNLSRQRIQQILTDIESARRGESHA